MWPTKPKELPTPGLIPINEVLLFATLMLSQYIPQTYYITVVIKSLAPLVLTSFWTAPFFKQNNQLIFFFNFYLNEKGWTQNVRTLRSKSSEEPEPERATRSTSKVIITSSRHLQYQRLRCKQQHNWRIFCDLFFFNLSISISVSKNERC